MSKLNEMQEKFIEAEKDRLIDLNRQKNDYLKLSTLSAEQFDALKSILRQIETAQGKIAFASQPVENTPERLEAIDKFIKNIEIEVDMPEAKEAKQITSFDVFVSNINNYIDKLIEHNEVLKEQLDCESTILDLLEAYQDEMAKGEISDAFLARIENSKKIKDDLTVAADCNTERLTMAADMKDKLIENYQLVSDINFFMNNPLNLPDYEERVKAVSSIL